MIKEDATMALRRKYRLADKIHRKTVDLRLHSQIIIDAINQTVPGKNPVVYEDHFSTDPLTQREAVSIGRALSKLPQLSKYGKTIMTFRLFDGRTYESGPTPTPVTQPKTKSKGGRLK
jgi:hypothetical protein